MKLDLKSKPLLLSELTNDLEEVPGLRIPLGAEHPHQALGGSMGQLAELLEAHRRVDVIPKDRLRGLELAGQQALHGLPEKLFTELRISVDPVSDSRLEISAKRHYECSLGCAFLRR